MQIQSKGAELIDSLLTCASVLQFRLGTMHIDRSTEKPRWQIGSTVRVDNAATIEPNLT